MAFHSPIFFTSYMAPSANLANFDLSDNFSFCIAWFLLVKLIGDKYLNLNEDDGSCLQDLSVIFDFGSLDLNANVYRICAKQCHLISPQQWLFWPNKTVYRFNPLEWQLPRLDRLNMIVDSTCNHLSLKWFHTQQKVTQTVYLVWLYQCEQSS